VTAIQGVAITPVTMTASGGTGTGYTFSATGLPAGLTMSASGTISGTPTVSGTFSYTVTVKDSAGNVGTINCSVTVAPPVSASCVAVTAIQGAAITPVTMTASGGTGTGYTFSATGLPAGLVMSASGTISGTPTVSGTFSYTVTVKDSAGNTGTINCSVTVAPPVSASCVAVTAIQGVAITPVTMTASGGTGSGYTFSATGLPAGLVMSATGTISGTATVSGTFSYTVTVKDSKGNTGTINCSVTVSLPPVSATCVSVTAIQGVAITPVTIIGSGGAGGLYTFTATGLPTGLSISSTGTISGTPTVTGTFSYTVTVKDSKGNTGTINCSVTVGTPPSASCVFGLSSAYNLIALSGNISDSADITGRIAAAGQVTQATTIGSGLRTNGDPYKSLASANGGPWAIVAAGGIPTSNSFSINAGGNVYSFTATGANFNFANENYSGSPYTGSKLVTGGTSPINFSTIKTEMISLSTQLAGLTANGAVCSVNNSGLIVAGGGCPSSSKTYNPSWLVLYGSSTTTNIFNLTQAQFQGGKNLDIAVPAGSTVIINVAGTSDTLQNSIYFNGATVTDANAGSILFNFSTATSVTINAQFDATLLAPYAALSGGSQMGGMFIAASIGSTGEVHYDPFTSTLPITGACAQ
jgi:choice-of-anchor A domain-containing protein